MTLWREISQHGQAKVDYILGGTAFSSPVWSKFLRDLGPSDITDIFIMLTAIGGFVLICCRIWRQWRHRGVPPKK